MEFKSLNLKNFENFSTFNVDNQQIKVKQYLPISDKNDLIQVALQKAEEGGVYNEILLDVYFHLNIIYLYTDIQFSDEDRQDEMKLYDILEMNDIINQTIACMGEGEYSNLRELLITMRDMNLKYNNTAAAVIRGIIRDLPQQAQAARQIVDSFDPEQYRAVIDFATAANGGRNINTQTAPISTAASQDK